MHTKYRRTFLPMLALAALLLGLSACGTNAGASGSTSGTSAQPASLPDRVQIDLEGPGADKNPTITLMTISLAQRLYSTTLVLPLMPTGIACTDELGPSYKLVFLRGNKMLATVVAQRFSCQVVTTEGSQQIRQAIPDFWKLVDQAVYAATPAAQPQWLAILHTSQAAQPPLTARIDSTTTTQRLYQAILELPLAPPSSNCSSNGNSTYSLLFHTANLALPAMIDETCNTIDLDGHFHARGGRFVMTDAFKQLLKQTLTGATFAPAQPDQLSLELQTGNSESGQSMITDASLIQRLYRKALALPLQTQPLSSACTSGEDKLKGTGTGYTFNFSQWGLPVLYVFAFKGSCTMITRGDSSQRVQGDSEFWDLVHQAAGA